MGRFTGFALSASLLLGLGLAPARAADLPVEGTKLVLRPVRSDTSLTRLSIRVQDSAVAAAFADPRAGASLVLSAPTAQGSCRVELALLPDGWMEIGRDGTSRGYRYRDRSPGPDAVRRVLLSPGRINVQTRGTALSCDLTATSIAAPISAELRVDGDRYCALFDEELVRRPSGVLTARASAAPATCPDADLTVANLNVLHGIGCSDPDCRRPDRIDLLGEWVADSGCPDVLTFQEVIDLPVNSSVDAIRASIAAACPLPYSSVFLANTGIDEQLVLSRYPILQRELRILFSGFRTVTFVRIDHPVGPVDVFSTHLASGADGGPNPCGASCPAACVAAGAATVRECQAVQMAQFVASRHDVDAPAVVTGDFNDPPGTFTYLQFAGRGWIDTHLAAGNPECDPGTGIGCTSGRASDLSEIESTAPNVDERIDYIFLVPPGPGSVCRGELDSPGDDDGDDTATRIFADDPNPFAACGAGPAPVCWPSDHEGNEIDLECH